MKFNAYSHDFLISYLLFLKSEPLFISPNDLAILSAYHIQTIAIISMIYLHASYDYIHRVCLRDVCNCILYSVYIFIYNIKYDFR